MEEEKNDEISYEIISQNNESSIDFKEFDLNSISHDESSTKVP